MAKMEFYNEELELLLDGLMLLTYKLQNSDFDGLDSIQRQRDSVELLSKKLREYKYRYDY